MSCKLDEKYKNILKNYIEIINRVKDFMKKDFDIEGIHDDKYKTIKIKFLRIETWSNLHE